MTGYVTDIEKETIANTNYRKVLFTAKNSQLVVMSLKPGEEIGKETHHLDQFIKIEAGKATIILNGKEHHVAAGGAAVIPQGTKHNVINTGKTELKLYSIYSPPEHAPETVHKTKADEPKHD